VQELLSRIRSILGLQSSWRVALVGAGKLGSALFSYRDFEARGFNIRAVFDSDPRKVGTQWGGLSIRADEEIDTLVRAEEIDIAIVAVPADAAQQVVERLVKAGVRGILNFAPARLKVPRGVALKNVDVTLELEGLSFALNSR
jgi:redox-sensing transcriptional repressor